MTYAILARLGDTEHELRAAKAKIADLERRIEEANDQIEHDLAAAIQSTAQHERDTAAVLAAEHAQHEAERALRALQDQVVGAMTDLPSARPAAYPLTDTELAWYVAQAREDQRMNGIVHPLAALADRVDRLHAGSERYPDVRSSPMRLVRWDDLEPLLSAVARTPA